MDEIIEKMSIIYSKVPRVLEKFSLTDPYITPSIY